MTTEIDGIQLHARIAKASSIIEQLQAQLGLDALPKELRGKIEDFQREVEMDRYRANRTPQSTDAEAHRLYASLRENTTIIPGGTLRNEDVLWNALIMARNALLSPYGTDKYDDAMRGIEEAIGFVRRGPGSQD